MKTVCIKIGGSTVDAAGFLDELGQAVATISAAWFPVIIHGGGKGIARMLDLMNKEFTFVEGMRVTDEDTLFMVQMVLSGDINKRIVNSLAKSGLKALGLSGVDANLFTAEKMLAKGKDVGLVGEIKKVDVSIISLCRQNNIVPVISPVSRGTDGRIYNVNADVAAAECAKALKADDLVFVSDVNGVSIKKQIAHSIKTPELEPLIAGNDITGGMVPKVRSAADAVAAGVGRVHICGWHGAQTFKEELSDTPSGTVIF